MSLSAQLLAMRQRNEALEIELRCTLIPRLVEIAASLAEDRALIDALCDAVTVATTTPEHEDLLFGAISDALGYGQLYALIKGDAIRTAIDRACPG